MIDHRNSITDEPAGVAGPTVRFGLLVLVYTALTVFVFRNFIPHVGNTLIGPPEDNMQDFWNTWYAASQVRTFHDLGYTNLIRHPEGMTLYYHSFAYPKLVVAMIFGALFGAHLTGLVALHNFLLVISFPISAIGGFYLVRHFTGDTFGGMVGGAVFAFNPIHVAHVQHYMHVSSIEFIPFFALFFILAVERRSRGFALLSTLCFALSALSCWYYLFYCAYFMAFLYVVLAIRQRRFLNVWPLIMILCNIVGLLVLLSPLLVPMVAQTARGLNVYEEGTDIYVADLFGYVTFPPVHYLSALSEPIHSLMTGYAWENIAYLGLVNIALLAWLILRRKRLDRKLIAFVLSGMGVFAVIASGSHLHVLGRSTIPLPDLLLSYLPFFKNVRAPARAMVLVYLFLSIGVGYAISTIWRERGATWVGRATITVIVMLIALDFYPQPLPGTPVVCLPAYSLVAQDPDRHAAVLDLPQGGIVENAYMAYQACHLHPIVGGNVARPVYQTLNDHLLWRDLNEQRRQLIENHVKYIVIHRPDGKLILSNLGEWLASQEYPRTYPVLYSGNDAVVFGVY